MQKSDAHSELSLVFGADSAARMLDSAQASGAYVTRGLRVTYSERHGFRVRRGASQRGDRGASRANRGRTA
jgi:hypothetical protein